MYFITIFFLIFFAKITSVYAEDCQYLSTKSAKINMRTGPDARYDIKYVYIKKNMPFKIKNTFEDWFLVEDIEGDHGWIKQNLFSQSKKLRFVMVKSKEIISCYNEPNKKIIFKANYLITFKLKKCEKEWCLVSKDKISGWCKKNDLWGI